MSRAATSLFVFAIYLIALGLCVLLVPNALLEFFDASPTHEIWIRLNGMFILCLSFYYIQAARSELTSFMRWTVPARVAVIVYFVVFVFLLEAPKALLLFGFIDLLSAIWTWFALRK